MVIIPLAATSIQNEASSDRSPQGIETPRKQPNSEPLDVAMQADQRIKQYNLDILEANRNASLSSLSQPLTLLYQTAIDAINAELAPTMGENVVERAHEEGLDVSPEATAERIVSLTMGTFGRFQAHHSDLPEAEQVDRFLALISSGIDQGFSAAKDILEGLSVLEGSIADNINRTYDLVQQGLQQFRQYFSADQAVNGKGLDDNVFDP